MTTNDKAGAEAALLEAVQALSQACLAPDASTLRALALPDLSYGHTDGRVQTRDELVAALVEGRSVFRAIELESQTVQFAGDTALVRHHALYRTFNGGVAGLSDVQVVQVWRRENDAWRLQLRQALKTSPQPQTATP